MSEFILKTPVEWTSSTEKLPEIGKPVAVLCVMISKASLLEAEPQMWAEEEDSEKTVEVKLWRELDEPA